MAMVTIEKQNANPTVYSSALIKKIDADDLDDNDADSRDLVNAEEVFELIRYVNDPEHPLTLEQLKVVTPDAIEVDDEHCFVRVQFTPTIPHCRLPQMPHEGNVRRLRRLSMITSAQFRAFIAHLRPCVMVDDSMATLIGLCIRVKLLRSLPSRFKVSVMIAAGMHSSEAAVNKQISDKERVAAALENSHLMAVVNKCIT